MIISGVGAVRELHWTALVMYGVVLLFVADLSNPATFRDLSKPIGALNEERLESFKVRRASQLPPSLQW